MSLRDKNLQTLKHEKFDVLIVGGGINGAVSAAALAGRGVKVALVDKGDFAGETSSQSSNLVWGGIKYLETHEYSLVSKLCKSRNHLSTSFPSTVKEIRFLTTIQKGFRYPALFVFFGAVFYWIIGRFFTKAPRYLSPRSIENLEPVIDTSNAQGGFEYSDCYLFDNDARFVFNFIRKAINNSACAVNYARVTRISRAPGDQTSTANDTPDPVWHAEIVDEISKDKYSVEAKIVINACGPYVDTFNQQNHFNTEHHHVFSKGIHLIVNKITESKKVLAFFAADGRLFFVIPMGPKTCIGTTDTKVPSPQTEVTEEDRQFVLDNVNHMLNLATPLSTKDIIAERCGVRPLAVVGQENNSDWVQLSRKHAIDVDDKNGLLSIFGGKLTDCLNIGDEVAALVAGFGIAVNNNEHWYGESAEAVRQDFHRQAAEMQLDSLSRPDIHEKLSDRLWRRYDKNAFAMLEAIKHDTSQADILIPNTEYRRCELQYIAEHEMVTKLEDFLRRRSKISLIMRPETLCGAEVLAPACKILFGDMAEAKLEEYLNESKR